MLSLKGKSKEGEGNGVQGVVQEGKGDCYNNALCENFLSHFKSKSLWLHPPLDREELLNQIKSQTGIIMIDHKKD